MASVLLSERRGAAQVLTISDPATRNTLSPQVYEAGSRALQAAAADAGVRAVVLRGDGAHFVPAATCSAWPHRVKARPTPCARTSTASMPSCWRFAIAPNR
ncbi:MAG: hypothetical protein U1E90_19405 [Burkholderiaceae bacterium]